MSSNVSGIPAATASTDHVIQFTAVNADGTESAGIATVTSTTDDEGRRVVPWSQLAAIPGFREGDVIDHADGEHRPLLYGPGPDAPGHPAWCTEHHDDLGGGRSLCWGETVKIGDASVQVTQPTGEPVTVWLDFQIDDQGEYLRPDEARERARELRQVADQLDAFAATAEAGIEVSR